jgi:hypothetical protein
LSVKTMNVRSLIIDESEARLMLARSSLMRAN